MAAHSQDQDILEVEPEDMEGLEDLADMEVLAEGMQETTEVVEEKGTVTAVVEIAMADAADGSRCKT